jgi:hypothetical protein
LEDRLRFADAASRYRLAGEIDDVIASREPDERTRTLRAAAAALTAQAKHAEAAAVYKQLITAN